MFPSPSQFEEYLNQLESLDLEEENSEEALDDLFQKLETLPIVSYPLPSDFPMTRARLNNDGERFDHVSQVWHKPEELNNGFGRASNPNNNVLYCAFDPYPDNKSTDKPVERITALCEVSDIYFTNPDETISETVTFARWFPGQQLNLVCPFDFSRLSSESPILEDMNQAYSNIVNEYEEYEDQITRFHTFIANQFAKHPIEEEHEYKITALFTEMIMEKGFDGVIYPSVKTDLRGFNVAVNSNIVEDNFNLFAVCECTHYLKQDYSFVNNDLLTSEIKEDGSFQLLPLEHPYTLPEEQVQKIIESNII
ncbi:malectin domain-containing carbohydrate-binding protein [Fodinibius sediminis]|uniref:RES domain-containing protein n=1 Tax=Fodinibius sediminis TaxID=1214077 RepID=A0A521F8R5_9BACT|nr:malectin domain-containing carbohydrate-binding protein [Fodinibius sediminis]SMO92516.1 RES domain-containing protein [Fodinibius sediminis]